jgi:hypothetical protein
VDVKIDPDDYLGDIDFTLMLAGQARKGPWSLFTDVPYGVRGEFTVPAAAAVSSNAQR